MEIVFSASINVKWPRVPANIGGAHFTLEDRDALLERNVSKSLKGWGVADQPLPEY